MKRSSSWLPLLPFLFFSLLTASTAGAFDFGGGAVKNPSVEITLKGKTSRPEGGPGTVELDATFRNLMDESLRGEVRVVLMAINDRINFDEVVVTELKRDGSLSDHPGFFAEEKALAPGARFEKRFRISLPAEARGKNLQVMALYYRFKEGAPPEMSKEVYALQGD